MSGIVRSGHRVRGWYAVALVSLLLGGARAADPAAYTWRSVKIVDGGEMPGLYFHPTQAGLMYIRANVGGAYRLDPDALDGVQLCRPGAEARCRLGYAWTPLLDWVDGNGYDWNLTGIESIALDPTDPERLYLAAGYYIESWFPPNGAILVSTDRGATFQVVDLPFKLGANDQFAQQGGERLAVNPFAPNELYLCTHANGLWRSSDHGATWNQMASFPITSSTDEVGVSFVRFDPRNNGVVYAGAYTGGMYESTNDGATWQQIPGQPTTLPDGEALRPMRCALGPDGALYVTYSNSATLGGISNGAVYKLDTQTGIWTDITPPDTQPLWYGYVAVGADAQRTGTVVVGTWNRWYPGDDFFRSTDGGATWASVRQYWIGDDTLSPYLNYTTTFGSWNASFEIDPFDSAHALYSGGFTVWATNDLTAMDSARNTHWTVGANGIEETVILCVVSPPEGAHLLSGMADLGGFRHDNFEVSPTPFLNPQMTEIPSLDYAGANPLLVARVGQLDFQGDDGGAYSTDGGTTWTAFAGSPPGAGQGPTGDGYAAAIAVSADGGTFVWAPASTVPAWSRDRGTTFTSSTGAPAALRVAADRVNPKKFYGYDAPSGSVFVSADGGATFTRGATGLPSDLANPAWLAEAKPKTVLGREGDIWLPLATGLYHSTDSGASFAQVGSIDTAPLVGFGRPAPGASYPAIYAVGTVNGVYGIFRSDDGGNSWTRINDDEHQYGFLDDITGDPRIYGRVYVGTGGRGIVYGDAVRMR